MARGFVVEGEGVDIVWVGRCADADDAGTGGGAGSEADPVERRGDAVGTGGDLVWLRRREAVGGVERVGEEGMLDVGGGEFEVLLLVFETEDDAALGFVFGHVGEETLDGRVDVATVGKDLVEGRAGEGRAELFFRHLAEGAVVAVKEPVEAGVEGLVAGDELGEDEGLEEPRGVREMPLDGRSFGAGLDHHVFRG